MKGTISVGRSAGSAGTTTDEDTMDTGSGQTITSATGYQAEAASLTWAAASCPPAPVVPF